MNSQRARLDIYVHVDCPECGYLIDILDPDSTDGFFHNEDGHIMKQACPAGHWSEVHEQFQVEGIVCSDCKHEFNVKGLDW